MVPAPMLCVVGCAQVRAMWKKKELIMGFGHRVYKKGDPRNPIHKELAKELAATSYGSPTLYKVFHTSKDISAPVSAGVRFCS